MENIFFIAAIISVVFVITKFIEMRFIERENKPLKLLVRDALLVYFSVILGYFIINQATPIINGVTEGGTNVTPIFTDNPEF
jgi:hypothetical protein